jgi:predicted transcriptional regulator
MADQTNVFLLPPKEPELATSAKTLEERWTKGVLEPGFVLIPSVVLRAQRRLHIDCVALAVLLHLIDHWWDNRDMPFPSKKRLGERIGVSDKTVQRAIKKLEDENVVKRISRYNKSGGQTSNFYDMAPLIEKLQPIAKDLVEARDDAKRTRRSPEKPGHALRKSALKKAKSV